MLRLEVTAEDISRARFVPSPAFELDFRLRQVRKAGTYVTAPGLQTPSPRALAELRRTSDIDMVLALQSTHYGPNFTAPVSGDSADFEADLDQIRATPHDVAIEEIRACLKRRYAPVDRRTLTALGQPDVVARIADALAAAWTVLLAPDWPRLRAVAERDIVLRAEQLRRTPWGAVLGGLDVGLRWRSGYAEFTRAAIDTTVASGGAGLILVPSALLREGAATHTVQYAPRVIVYPASSTIEGGPGGGVSLASLAALLGPTRATLLVDLAEPSTTTSLAIRLHASVGGIGDHLAVLHRAGLLQKSRNGRSVLYRRSAAGDDLVRAATLGR